MPTLPANALQHRVILISTTEDIIRRRALQELREVAAADDGLDSETYLAGEAAPANWLAAASTLPFLAERRCVFVRNLLREADPKEAIPSGPDALKALPPTALLVLVADDEPGDEQRQRDYDKRRTAWESFVEKAGGYAVAYRQDSSKLAEDLKRQLVSDGVNISGKALMTLADMTGGSYSRALEEAEKLKLFVGDGVQIQEADVLAVVVPAREWNVYKLGDAILSGSLGQAMAQLRNLMGVSKKPEDAAFSQVFPTLLSQLKLIWQARLCVEARCAPTNAPENVRAQFPAKGDISKERDWKIKRAMGTARNLSLTQISDCLQIVADADAAMKGQAPSFSGIETLEQTVMKMAAVAKRGA